MDIKQLKYLIALDETQHFGQAAAMCHITQPTLSMRIRNLEEELQLTLINVVSASKDLPMQASAFSLGRAVCSPRTTVCKQKLPTAADSWSGICVLAWSL